MSGRSGSHYHPLRFWEWHESAIIAHMTDPRDQSPLVIRSGRVVDPASGFDETADVLIERGRIAKIGRVDPPANCKTIDAEGCIVAPGLIDIHVHFREPGHEYKETIATGCAGAVRGGFTTVCVMPNTKPPLDSVEAISLIDRKAREANLCRVFTVAAATVERKGEAVGAIHSLAQAGAVAFSDDGDCIMNSAVMRDVLTLCRESDRAFMQHCQDVNLAGSGVMNAGPLALRMGLPGWPAIAEEIIIERDIRINRAIGAAYHVQHISSGESVAIVRRGQREGQPITAEASPHHLLLTEDACAQYDTNAKMNPPLRTQRDVDALKEAIADGTITVLATDHAPHAPEEKELDFESAPFGIIGVECALPLYIRALIDDQVIDWPRLIALMTHEPARLVGLDRLGLGTLAVGGPADVTIIDPDMAWTIDAREFSSKSRNCPFDGWPVRGRAVATIVAGRVVSQHGVSERVRG